VPTSLPCPGKLPFDPEWFTDHQYYRLINVVAKPDGIALLTEIYRAVCSAVDSFRDRQLTPGQTIRRIIARTRGVHPGIEQTDLIPIMRGILTAIYEELPE
jgi:hypothetical protein